MVELSQLKVGQKEALGIRVYLPRGLLQIIIQDHKIVCDTCIDLQQLTKKNPHIYAVQCKGGESFQDMLEMQVLQGTMEAIKQGVNLEMKIIDVLTLL